MYLEEYEENSRRRNKQIQAGIICASALLLMLLLPSPFSYIHDNEGIVFFLYILKNALYSLFLYYSKFFIKKYFWTFHIVCCIGACVIYPYMCFYVLGGIIFIFGYLRDYAR